MVQRLLVGEWWLLRLLIDPTTGSMDHPLGTVLHVVAALDGPGRWKTQQLLEHPDVPDTVEDPGLRARVEASRGRGRPPLVRVMVLRGPLPEQSLEQTVLDSWDDHDRGTEGALDLAEGLPEVPTDESGTGLLGEWSADDYLRIRAADRVEVPLDVALVVLRVSNPVGPRAGDVERGGLTGLGVLPVEISMSMASSRTAYAQLGLFDPAPAAVVVVRNRPLHGPLRQGMVVEVGRARQSLVGGSLRVVDVAASGDDDEVAALRRRLLYRVLVEPTRVAGQAPFTLYPSRVADYDGSRHAG
ncbi:hypothetical protein [Microlunatus antarcticus]|uniref:Uncharacterized protein n=1 Tax=Microlunatus antarcticus TaxID=53388 RepID=A0A7W5JVM5_9ACTN|nr:hypothetical protein [Microlunatus antarcticus]MBB3327118.1 hypothetical protein [Microlunatus antarcticus]